MCSTQRCVHVNPLPLSSPSASDRGFHAVPVRGGGGLASLTKVQRGTPRSLQEGGCHKPVRWGKEQSMKVRKTHVGRAGWWAPGHLPCRKLRTSHHACATAELMLDLQCNSNSHTTCWVLPKMAARRPWLFIRFHSKRRVMSLTFNFRLFGVARKSQGPQYLLSLIKLTFQNYLKYRALWVIKITPSKCTWLWFDIAEVNFRMGCIPFPLCFMAINRCFACTKRDVTKTSNIGVPWIRHCILIRPV